MEGNGPGTAGKPRPLGVLVAGADTVTVDVACCRIAGIDTATVPGAGGRPGARPVERAGGRRRHAGHARGRVAGEGLPHARRATAASVSAWADFSTGRCGGSSAALRPPAAAEGGAGARCAPPASGPVPARPSAWTSVQGRQGRRLALHPLLLLPRGLSVGRHRPGVHGRGPGDASAGGDEMSGRAAGGGSPTWRPQALASAWSPSTSTGWCGAAPGPARGAGGPRDVLRPRPRSPLRQQQLHRPPRDGVRAPGGDGTARRSRTSAHLGFRHRTMAARTPARGDAGLGRGGGGTAPRTARGRAGCRFMPRESGPAEPPTGAGPRRQSWWAWTGLSPTRLWPRRRRPS